MSYFYPQAVMTLRVRWEDFDQATNAALKKVSELTVIANNVTVSINDYTQADTFRAEIDYKSFPFDPRTIRALGATIHLQDMKTLYTANGLSNHIVPRKDNTIFVGFADTESIKLGNDNRIISFEGRDFTALLIDSKYEGNVLDLGKSLDKLIQELLDRLPTVSQGKLAIDSRIDGALPTLGKFAPDYNVFANSRSGKKNETYWDVIQDLVGRAGLICFVELDKLVITKSQVLYGDARPCQFVYGKNLEELNFERKLGRQKGLNVIVRSVSIESKEVLTVKIPEEASTDWLNKIGLKKEAQKIKKFDAHGKETDEIAPYQSFAMPNIKNIEQLREIAQGIWEELGRQQISGDLRSKEMLVTVAYASGTSLIEFDLTKIRNGTPIQVEIDQGDLEGFKRQSTVQQRTRFLIERGYESSVAEALAVSTGKFKTRFYTKSAELQMGVEGFSFRADFVNFIELGNRGLT